MAVGYEVYRGPDLSYFLIKSLLNTSSVTKGFPKSYLRDITAIKIN